MKSNQILTVITRILKSWYGTSEGLYNYMMSCQHQVQLAMTMVMIEQGNYASIIEDFNQVFDQNVYLVDGELILNNPNEEFDLLLDFFGLEKGVLNFQFNQDRGFHCLERPLNYCLGGNKGTTRNESKSDIYRDFPQLEFIQHAYRAQMAKTFKYIYSCDENCCAIELNRFAWLRKYICQ